MPAKKTSAPLSSQTINSHKKNLALAVSVILGLLGLSAFMVGVFSTQNGLIQKVLLICAGVVPMALAPVVYRKVNTADAKKGLLFLVLTIETVLQKELITKFSMVYNLGFGILKLLLGLFTASVFMAVSAVSSLCFGLGKRIYIKGAASNSARQIQYYFRIALLILGCGISYGWYMARFFYTDNSINYSKPLGILIAAVAFTELFFSIKNLWQGKGMLHSAIRYISLASSIQAISFAQVAILSFSSTGNNTFGYAMGGVISGALCVIIALVMLWKYRGYAHRTAVQPPPANESNPPV